MSAKILIHLPMASICWPTIESIADLDVEGLEVDWYITRGQPDYDVYDETGKRKGTKYGHYVAEKMNKARKVVLKFGYDYLLNIEHDHIFPRQTLKLLLSYASLDTCVSALYCPRKSQNSMDIFCLAVKSESGVCTYPPKKEVLSKEIFPVWICCFGFTLFGRKVLEKIEFGPGIDGEFAVKAGSDIERFVVTPVKVGHIDKSGEIFWPF